MKEQTFTLGASVEIPMPELRRYINSPSAELVVVQVNEEKKSITLAVKNTNEAGVNAAPCGGTLGR